MDYKRKTYVEFEFPGSFLSETKVEETVTRTLEDVKVPKNAFSFLFFDILSTTVKADGEDVELTSGRIKISPKHYYGGEVYTLAQMKEKFPNNRTLISNFEGNGWAKGILCRTGNWQVFGEEDTLVAGLSRISCWSPETKLLANASDLVSFDQSYTLDIVFLDLR
ncbi:MAG: hypothetical protein JWM20_743, partial [Patescibacteria group bacterium]|nr:hypothetical protein [Patescibacteria group bacterium]